MALRTALRTAATGFILMYFSENLFWARWRPGNSVPDFIYTWIAYSLMAFLFLWLISKFRVRSLWTVFLVGAVFGWIGEGIVVQTTYDQLPLSISFTALAWHASISVMVGWYLLRKTLQRNNPFQTAKVAALIGLCYGLWAIFWWTEPGSGTRATVAEFALFSFATNILAILAYMLYDWTAEVDFAPGRTSKIVIGSLALLQFVLVAVPKAPIAAIVLPLLLLITYSPLKRNRDNSTAESLLTDKPAKVARWNYLLLLLLPLTATVFYAGAYSADLHWKTNWILYAITTPLGFMLYILSYYHTLKTPKDDPDLTKLPAD